MDKSQVAVGEAELPGFPVFKKGKVRNVFDLGDKLLIVATDRISAFDFVLPSLIPYKGQVLTQLSKFWFDFTFLVCRHHMISTELADFPAQLRPYADLLYKRSMLVKKTRVVPIECVVRGYLSGSGWKEYQETGKVSGIKLPKGLQESSRLDEPIFTPSTKAEVGHDENITFKEMEKLPVLSWLRKSRRLALNFIKKPLFMRFLKGSSLLTPNLNSGWMKMLN